MPESLKKLRIFAASPSDVANERAKLATVIDTLKPMADFLGLRLEIVDWRVVVPDAGRPQQVIFNQLKPTSWDIFIGVLWHRFGTPSGAKDPHTQKEYLSGTEEEFRAAYRLWKDFRKPRIVMYCCTRPISQDADFVQAQRVKDFLKEIRDPEGEFRVLTQSFDTPKAFEKLLLDHLQKLLIEYSEQEGKQALTVEEVQSFSPRVPDNLPHRMPFFGREKEIKKVMDALSPAERGWGAIIDGIGGIGKTTLAVEVAHRCKEMGVFDAFMFVTAKREYLEPNGIKITQSVKLDTLDGFISEMANVLAKPSIGKLTSEDKRRALLNTLREARALLIFDNTETLPKEEQEALIDWLRFLPKDCKAILTSRRYIGGSGALWLRLDKLEWVEAKAIIQNESSKDEFLAKIFGEANESYWLELYDATGGSPLALLWTLGLMSMRSLNLDNILHMLRQESAEGSELKRFMYEEALRDIGTNGSLVLFALSFFAPSAAFDALLEVTGLSRVELETTLERLNALSLVNLLSGEERYAMHLLTKIYAQQNLNEDLNLMLKLGLRFVRYWTDYSMLYGNSIKTYDRLESEWMNLKAAYSYAKRTAKIDGDTISNEEIARLGITFIRSLQQFLLASKRWDEGVEMDSFGYSMARALNIPFLRALTIESSDERTDFALTPKIEGNIVSQRIVPSMEKPKHTALASAAVPRKGMRTIDIIVKKRDHLELTRDEIYFFINGVKTGAIPDYQAASLMMAFLLNGMTVRETTDITLAMAQSGTVLDFSDLGHPVVDKHSTGGVGDKVSFVVLPIVAACGLPVGKMSGRGLGFSGGTLDKLESIPGYRVNLTAEEYKHQLLKIGIVLSGQTLDLAPVDGKLYALRDVTGSVQSIPLIASSVLSKKIASGVHAVVLDVKVGNGAFMQNLDDARELAELMMKIGQMSGRKIVALLSDMNQPLGYAVGNALEVREAIETLHGGGPKDLIEHCLQMSAHMLVLGEAAENITIGYDLARKAIVSNRAFNKFRELVDAQGGDVSYVDNPNKLPQAKYIEVIESPQDGYLSKVHARTIGETVVKLGAGRSKKGDLIDYAVGVVVHHKVGDKVVKGEPLLTLHSNHLDTVNEVREYLMSAYAWSEKPIHPLPLFYT